MVGSRARPLDGAWRMVVLETVLDRHGIEGRRRVLHGQLAKAKRMVRIPVRRTSWAAMSRKISAAWLEVRNFRS